MTPHQMHPRMRGNTARINAYDRRLASIHEAGHMIMAVHQGYDAHGWIHPSETDTPLEKKTWLGHMTAGNLPLEIGHSHLRRIGIAGMVAETLWKNGHHAEYVEPYGFEDELLDEDCMSYSDWRMADCLPGEPDDDLHAAAAEVAALFMSDLWTPLIHMSRMLMRNAPRVIAFSPIPPAAAVAA